MGKTAIYMRVSTAQQKTDSQEADLKRWASARADDEDVLWFQDTGTGKSMNRENWENLYDQIRTGKVSQLVVWRLDRLGRTASGLTTLFEDLSRLNVNLVSLKEGIDLCTPAGRMMANILASIAAFETELRGERVQAGQATARAAGKKWGGRRHGGYNAKVEKKIDTIYRLHNAGESLREISKLIGISVPTISKILRDKRYTHKMKALL